MKKIVNKNKWNLEFEYMNDIIAKELKPKLEHFTEEEYEGIYQQWLTKVNNPKSLWQQIEKYGTEKQLQSVRNYINWRYYCEHPIIIRDDDAGNHVNLMKEIGARNYITCSTFWACLRRNSGKTTDSIIYWLLARWTAYKERGAYIRRRDNDLKECLKEMKKEMFITLKPMGFHFDKGAIIETSSGEPVISFRSLTGQVNSSSSFAHVNIVYDEPIPIKGDVILNETDLLMQLGASLFRDMVCVGRMIMISNANTLRTPLLEDLMLDYDSFNKNPKQILSTPFGTKVWLFFGFNIKPNRINSNYYGSPVAAFMSNEQYDFLINGKFSFDNMAYQWSLKAITIIHYHAIYVFNNIKFVEVTAIHRKTNVKRMCFIPYAQISDKLLEQVITGCPMFVFRNKDIVSNPDSQIIPDPIGLLNKWLRGIKQDGYRFTSFMIPTVIKDLVQMIKYGIN